VIAPLVGVLGGMGPAATSDFYATLIRRTPAIRDQDHLRVVIWADPSVPDRVGAVLDGSSDPYPAMLAGARALCGLGVTIAAMPCHTAHVFLPRLIADTGLEFVDMVRETARVLGGRPNSGPVGLLATRGTLRSGLYQRRLGAVGLATVTPDEDTQRQVDRAIASVKSAQLAEARQAVECAVCRLAEAGAHSVVLACTELPVVLRGPTAPHPSALGPTAPHPSALELPSVIDPTELLADAVIRRYRAAR
jgi:aspartate racemase